MPSSETGPSRQVRQTAVHLWKANKGQHWLPIQGRSMWPLIRQGDAVLVHHDVSRIRQGDVVVFEKPEVGVIAHRALRVYRRSERRILAKGDNVPLPDPSVTPDEVIGVVQIVRRNGKEMRRDTAVWRIANRLIAWGMLVQMWLYLGARGVKRRWLGPAPHPVADQVRNLLWGLFRLPWRLGRRWRR